MDAQVTLVQDAGSRTVAALGVHDEGADTVLLGPSPPGLPKHPLQPAPRVDICFHLIGCDFVEGERSTGALAVYGALKSNSPRKMARLARERESNPAATPEELLEVAFALRRERSIFGMRMASSLIARLAERFPDHPEVRLAAASRIVDKGVWTGARELLTGIDPAVFDRDRAQHLWHLRALVALRQHRLEEAAEALEAANGLEGQCVLRLVDELIEPVPATIDESTPPIARLRFAIHAADASLDRGDAAGVLELLDRPMIWEAREAQSLARLAEAHLRLEVPAGCARVRKLTALGAVLDTLSPSRMADRIELPYRGAWDEARLTAVVARARAWLDVQ